LNNIEITGNLTSSKGIKVTTASKVAKRSIAENLKDDKVQYTDLEAWGDKALSLESFEKGAYVTVKGFLKHGEYEKDGVKRKTVHVVVTSIAKAAIPEKKTAAAAPVGDAMPEPTEEEFVGL
jgi:single-stranded DNA-binding protein